MENEKWRMKSGEWRVLVEKLRFSSIDWKNPQDFIINSQLSILNSPLYKQLKSLHARLVELIHVGYYISVAVGIGN